MTALTAAGPNYAGSPAPGLGSDSGADQVAPPAPVEPVTPVSTARYVLCGTLRRGRGDVECFVRLVHSESGQVVASADAYAQAVAPAQEQEFFALVAGRLRQEFPVLQGTLAAGDGGVPIIDRGRQAGVVGRMRFFVMRADADVVDPATGRVLLPGEKRVQGTLEVDKVDDRRARLKRVDGAAAAGGTVVSE
ncbi:MAG: hypothetical protein H0W83_00885 [Planctomycetes bacterium]|nr:hypothetical protein [Planctomycetota bacterium]